ncbi:zinc finger CCCH domain-containing protein 4-like isoform X2 [Mizuhopecten yessoensis]|uniref:zinc finger CCCH domain-containing protein 4-like isoform X2 n=1 Tax=Mizuhopecten yessoensis TaxID=6573 RepID=UPI000B45F35C|nr:zinc finger CCCH domain-containing protein 4-like isoform X2 [Mizuhopecten yessoensis]
MELAEQITESDKYGENDTQTLNSEGEEEENHYEEEYRSERRRKKSFSDPDEKCSTGDVHDGDANSAVDYNNKHVKRMRSGGDHSDGDSDHRHHSRHHPIDRERDREHGNHRRRHHRSRRRDRERSRHSRRNNDSRSSQELEAELEDGELEDGELDDDGQTEGHNPDYRDFPENAVARASDGEEEGNIDEKERSRPRKDDHDDKKRRKEKRDKEKRRKQQKEDKKKKKRRDYHDYDKVEEEQAWGTGTDKHVNQNTRDSRGSYDRSPPGPYDDHFEDQGRYERNYNSPPGHYDSPYDSPPGPYDSPSYDEDSEGEIYEQGNQRKPRRTMMSMVEDDYVDANVAIDEGENIYKQPSVSNKKMKHMKQMKRKMDRQQQADQPPKKKPLLLTPMNERPICKFYKEGKCSKGNDCPFNHDYRPPKKMDLCKFYLNSQCSKGDNCIFMHGEFPCKFFHTGAKCYSGDNCKFSHDPLTDETGPLVDKFFQDFPREEEMYTEGQRMGPPRPSLLGSPPRHITDQSDRVKKIPSIFDIKVYPPGQSPKKPMLNDGPPNIHPPQMCGPSPRPSGFYNDMNQPPPMQGQGPPMPHQQGPQMPGPNQQGPSMPGPHQQGPHMSGPRQQGPPMSGPHQQGPPMSGPHQQGPLMSGPHQQGPPMPGPRPHGPPMSGPNLQGPGMPPMQGPPMRGPHMQGPPMQNPPVSSSAMNPAVALVGALLRQAAPQVLRQNIRPPGPQNLRHPGSQNMRPPGPQNMAPPGPMQNMPPPFKGPNQTGPFSSTQGTYGPSSDTIMSPTHEQNPAPADKPLEDKEGDHMNADRVEAKAENTGRNTKDPEKTEQSGAETDPEAVSADEESNEKKLSTLGVNLDTLTHLPAKQRELFLRIQNQQGDGVKDAKADQEDKVDQAQMDDDNWYSSDEEDVSSSKPKLTDILKNLSQQPTPDSPQTPVPTSHSQSSALDIMQMINSIRTQANTNVGTPDIPANSNPPTFPKDASGVAQFTNDSPKVFTASPDPVIINSSEGDIPYKLRLITVDQSQYNKPPQGMDVHHVQFKNDPRIKKFLIYLESLPQKEVKPVKPVISQPAVGVDTVEVVPKIDPRTGQPAERRMDPRFKLRVDAAIEGSRSLNPHLQGSVSDNLVAQSNIPPHLQRAPSNPLPTSLNMGINPRPDIGPQKPLDPRMARQMSRDGNATGGLPPKADPRIGRQMAGPPFASSNGMAVDPLSRQVDSRMGSQDPRKGQQDPRKGPQDPRMGPQDPRIGLQDPRMGLQDPRMGLQDPRMGLQDPRMGQQDPRMGQHDPRMGPQDPRKGSQDLRMGLQDSRLGPQDPRSGPQDPRSGPKDPRSGPQDPRSGPQDPRSGPQDPRSGPQEPRIGNKDPRVNPDPRKFPQDPRTIADMESQRPIDPRSLQRQGSIGADPRKPSALDPRRSLQGDMSSGQSSSDSENKKIDESDTPKPKLDYRNDPRFKRKPASESVVHKRYTGQRKSSMDYSSPLGLDSEDKGEGTSGYNSYHRPPPDSAKHKTDNRGVVKNKLDPRTSKPEGSSSPNVDSSPIPPLPPDGDICMPVALELPPFIPPNALEPQMKDFFKTMDPTASPFC